MGTLRDEMGLDIVELLVFLIIEQNRFGIGPDVGTWLVVLNIDDRL
jgi:hypothetical protein